MGVGGRKYYMYTMNLIANVLTGANMHFHISSGFCAFRQSWFTPALTFCILNTASRWVIDKSINYIILTILSSHSEGRYTLDVLSVNEVAVD